MTSIHIERAEKPGRAVAAVENFLVKNLLPVTPGDLAGGAIMVGGVSGFVCLRTPAKEHS
jgi:formate/nitrite transporter FocA (FNT family)